MPARSSASPATATNPRPMPIGHMPCTIAQTQVSGTSHQRSLPSSRVRIQAAVVITTNMKLSTCGRMDRPVEAATTLTAVRTAASSGSTQRRATR